MCIPNFKSNIFYNTCVCGLPITLFQKVAFLLTSKLFVSLQLVHAVATLLTLRVLREATQHRRTKCNNKCNV